MEKYQQILINNLKKYRNIMKLSQSHFAELCNVSTGTIGNIECGVAKPSFDLLLKMCKVLGISPSIIFNEDLKTTENPIICADRKFLTKIYSSIQKYLQPEN